MLEARYHRVQVVDVDLGGRAVPHTVAGEVLCGCGSCGHVLAQVEAPLIPVGPLRWAVAVRHGYSAVEGKPGLSRRSRHAQRSPRGAPHKTPRWKDAPAFRKLVTARGDLVRVGPSGTVLGRESAGAFARVKLIATLGPGDAITIGCQQKSPHLSQLSYEGLMRQAFMDRRLMPA